MAFSTEVHSNSMKDDESPLSVMPRYRRLWRYSIFITVVVAVFPLLIMTALNYQMDKSSYRSESRHKITRMLSNTKRTLSFVVQERRSVLSLIIKEHPYSELIKQGNLHSTLRNLQDSFGGFVDLGIINSVGDQIAYAGPYDLAGRNYKDQDWFHEVNLRGVYVSDVFLGLRGFPHFVIAFKHDNGEGDFYVLRATLDMELLTDQIYSLDLDRDTDAFIINEDGILQTSSAFYGRVLENVDRIIPPHSRLREVVEVYENDGNWFTSGYAYIADTPFILMAITKQKNPFTHWIQTQSEQIWFLIGGIIAICVVTYYSTTRLINKLKEADMRRAKMMHNIEYTNKMATIGRMAAGVSHEINNPLAIINEKAGLMKDMVNFTEDFPAKEKTLKLIDSILYSVERCSKVTHRLLGFSRRMDMQKELIDLEHLLKEVIGFQSKEIALRGIDVNYEIEKDLPSIESDRGQLQQVFLNLFNNALSAMEHGGRIEISAKRLSSKEVAVTVTDNGIGIRPENLEHIFEPFYSTKGDFGTGLGLSITNDIVNKLGGRIEVESEVGKGTSFTITLPIKR